MSNSSASLATQNNLQVRVSVLSGPNKGFSYRIVGYMATLGRGEKNNIVINDKKVSRSQLSIKMINNRVHIKNLNEKNPFIYNNTKINNIIVHQKETFKIGDTTLKVELISGKDKKNELSNKHFSAQPTIKRKPRTLVVAAVSILILSGLFLMKEDDSKKDIIIRDIARVIKPSTSDKMEQEIINSKLTKRRQRAQVKYVGGFRAYKNHLFENSSLLFKACLSIDPSHSLCEKYFRLSQVRLNKLVQEHVRLGQKYLNQRQYSHCISEFKNVMYIIKNKSDEIYAEAKKSLAICTAKKKNRF